MPESTPKPPAADAAQANPLPPVDPDREPVAQEGAEFVVISHALGPWQRGDRLSRKALNGVGVTEARIGELVALGGLSPLPPEPKPEPKTDPAKKAKE